MQEGEWRTVWPSPRGPTRPCGSLRRQRESTSLKQHGRVGTADRIRPVLLGPDTRQGKASHRALASPALLSHPLSPAGRPYSDSPLAQSVSLTDVTRVTRPCPGSPDPRQRLEDVTGETRMTPGAGGSRHSPALAAGAPASARPALPSRREIKPPPYPQGAHSANRAFEDERRRAEDQWAVPVGRV